MIKKCAFCGKEFEPVDPRHKTCGKECRIARNKAKAKECHDRNRDERLKKQRAKIKPIFCKICGEVVERDYSGIRATAKTYHEKCVVSEALQAVKKGKTCYDYRIRRALNNGYTISELREMIEEENNDK